MGIVLRTFPVIQPWLVKADLHVNQNHLYTSLLKIIFITIHISLVLRKRMYILLFYTSHFSLMRVLFGFAGSILCIGQWGHFYIYYITEFMEVHLCDWLVIENSQVSDKQPLSQCSNFGTKRVLLLFQTQGC